MAVAAGALLAACAPATAEPPLPAIARPVSAAVAVRYPTPAPQRVRIVDVRVVNVPRGDRRLSLLAGAGRDFQAREGMIVAARVATPFVGMERTASPVIVIGGRVVDSIVDEDSRQTVYALLPAWAATARPVSMQVGWLGDFERTLSPPVTVSLAPRRPIRRR